MGVALQALSQPGWTGLCGGIRSFFSPNFLMAKKSGGIRPILDLYFMNGHIVWRPFRMLMVKQLLEIYPARLLDDIHRLD